MRKERGKKMIRSTKKKDKAKKVLLKRTGLVILESEGSFF